MSRARRAEKSLGAILVKTPVWLLIVIAFALANWAEFGKWEGHLLPVTSKATLISHEKTETGYTISMTFEKDRTCNYRSLAFFWIDKDGTQHRLPWTETIKSHATEEKNRPQGLNAFTMHVAAPLPPENWTAYVTHKCHPLWNTVTKFWP